jgi:hypothetical protein
MPWLDAVRATGKLSVFLHDSLDRSSWGTVFKSALSELNTLSARHKLGVTMVQSGDPPDDNGGGSNVQVEVPKGQPEFTIFGDKHVFNDEPFDQTGLHGLTLRVAVFVKGFRRSVKAFVFVPGTPSITKRLAGDPVRLYIAVHELVHVCGLKDAAHARRSEANPGVFMTLPGTFEGKTPSDDRIKLKDAVFVNGAVVTPPLLSPPITLSPSTIQLVQQNWEQ